MTTGGVTGYAFDGPADARSLLEPLFHAYGSACTERDGQLVFHMQDGEAVELAAERLAETDEDVLEITRAGLDTGLPGVRARYFASEEDHMPAVAWAETEAADELDEIKLPLAMNEDLARECARQLSAEIRLSRTRAQFAMAADGMVIEPGDVVALDEAAWRIIARVDTRQVSFRAVRDGAAGAGG